MPCPDHRAVQSKDVGRGSRLIDASRSSTRARHAVLLQRSNRCGYRLLIAHYSLLNCSLLIAHCSLRRPMMPSRSAPSPHPLRHPAARGRVVAGDRRGRRRRDVRRQVSRRRPGPEGADRRAGRRRDRARARPAGPGARASSSSTRVWPRRARPGDPGSARARARAQRRHSISCPARSPSTRSPPPARRRAGGDIVWLDALVTNVDRTPRNPNLLLWHGKLWLIDHGAALYIHHAWPDLAARGRSPFPQIARARPAAVRGIDAAADATPSAAARRRRLLAGIVGLIPDVWLEDDAAADRPAERRAAYVDLLHAAAERAPSSWRRPSVPERLAV